MIEAIMYFGIGFLLATLVAVALVPFVHSRAVRLTMRRLEDSSHSRWRKSRPTRMRCAQNSHVDPAPRDHHRRAEK